MPLRICEPQWKTPCGKPCWAAAHDGHRRLQPLKRNQTTVCSSSGAAREEDNDAPTVVTHRPACHVAWRSRRRNGGRPAHAAGPSWVHGPPRSETAERKTTLSSPGPTSCHSDGGRAIVVRGRPRFGNSCGPQTPHTVAQMRLIPQRAPTPREGLLGAAVLIPAFQRQRLPHLYYTRKRGRKLREARNRSLQRSVASR